MKPPDDHAALLARHDFTVPPGGDLSAAERDLLAKYGRWMEALDAGIIQPVTASQEQFLRAARGEQPPATDFEAAWAKFARLRADVAGCFDAFARARAEVAAVEAEYRARRAAVLAKVQDELDAVDRMFAARMQAAADAVAAGEAAVRETVLRAGQPVHMAGVHAAYHPGRVSWDAARMDALAAAHPEIMACRKVGKPWVSLRYTEPDTAPPSVRQLPAGTRGELPEGHDSGQEL